ncbi:FtsX-like permease family protein [Streptomyces sp. MUM 16J]|uniref:ABC transporter permease n=1 Tax=Streptomyces sp. MUM 16J TaxID=2791988 RepID=UPI001F04F595|nr:FtsX-like permease family protein [Streptomyces sp. MUM 16J]MCH0561182.1 FtsX-like permease family protein [Streptomyces sp. MUM 16J]
MSAVWQAAWAAVRRRILQTTVIGVVVLLSTATMVIALGLLDAASRPFDRAFAEQRGAHAVAAFDTGKTSPAVLKETARKPGVEAAAGPFGQTSVSLAPGSVSFLTGPLRVVGRGEPGGPVDDVKVWSGRWATGPGEIVVNATPPAVGTMAPFPLGGKIVTPEGSRLTIVGYAYTLSRTADAWVSPAQMETMHPTATQMLYRFTSAATQAEVDRGMDEVASDLPKGALLAAQSYLTVKAAIASGPGVYVPFLMVFGVLGVLVAVLIVANVISGAVVSGFKHIGVLKSLGFTARQVVSVYLLMVSLPTLAGCLLGTVGGALATGPLLTSAFQGMGMDLGSVGLNPWVCAAALVSMPVLVALAAVVPAMRAHRLSAAEAISAGSAPKPGRGLRIQRVLSGSRLPRSISLGLGLPFTRPGRSAMTLVAVLLGVTTATFATGLVGTVTQFGKATTHASAAQITVQPGQPQFGEKAARLSDRETEQMLRKLEGTRHVTADVHVPVSVVGSSRGVVADFLRGDADTLGFQDQLVTGRWVEGAGEAAASSAFLRSRDLKVGDELTLEVGGKQTRTRIVGSLMGQQDTLYADWATLSPLGLDVTRLNSRYQYLVQVAPGTDVGDYMASVRAADGGLYPRRNEQATTFTAAVLSLSSVLTLMLASVAALGVFNTVVLNTRERRRDLGTLQSIGMTPRQVIAMTVTSMAAVGAVGGVLGIPVGVLAHRVIMPIAAGAAKVDLARSTMDVWQVPVLAALGLAGVAIAVAGAYIPARAATRLAIAETLHNE